MTIQEKIDQLIEREYDCGDHVSQCSSVDGETLETKICQIIEESEEARQYSTSDETCFESCGYDCGMTSVAWVDAFGILNHITIKWERL